MLALKVTDFWKAEKEVSWLEIAKHLGKAKRTKIPRTALECKARYLFLFFLSLFIHLCCLFIIINVQVVGNQ